MNKKIITLTGFMGCGKTYVSKILAREIGYGIIDSDAEIERRAGKSIPQIMAEEGEAGFRLAERCALEDILSGEFFVLSAGGGAILKNADLLMSRTTVVFLDTDFDKCYGRIKNDRNRPLAAGKSRDEIFRLYRERYEIYRTNCHFSVKHEDAAITVKKIKEFLQNN